MGTNQRDNLEQLAYSLFGNFVDSLPRKSKRLETVSQFHLALIGSSTDTRLPLCLAFQLRRKSDAYSSAELGCAKGPDETALTEDEG